MNYSPLSKQPRIPSAGGNVPTERHIRSHFTNMGVQHVSKTDTERNTEESAADHGSVSLPAQCNCAIHTNLIISTVPGRATLRLDKVRFFTPDAQVSRTELRPDQHIICHPLKTGVIHYCHDSPSQRRCITAMKRPDVQGGKED
ncbi:hypothetical protein DPX16_1300 [Anabarilius grahami]|uniref:Uncharacterized protein n=1 Tax=Anabarilius grahami TaxID=495550 RepID=A0A3N0Y7D2_ANAGA|nr:hypothetical protein DPX16_1300 [Anabarilius grahami]